MEVPFGVIFFGCFSGYCGIIVFFSDRNIGNEVWIYIISKLSVHFSIT